MVFVQASTEKAFDSETGYIAINHIWGLINCNSGIALFTLVWPRIWEAMKQRPDFMK